MIEVVLDVGDGLDDAETDSLGQIEIRLAVSRTFQLDALRELGQRRREVGDAEGDMTERSALTRPLGVEQRDLAAPRIRAEQREPLGLVDRVHAEMRGDELGDRLAVGDPVRDVVELRRVHDLDGTRQGPRYAWSSGVFWTLCSVAYASVSWFTTSMPSL